jgi:D-alanyl-D-alanine carboxypeptidase
MKKMTRTPLLLILKKRLLFILILLLVLIAANATNNLIGQNGSTAIASINYTSKVTLEQLDTQIATLKTQRAQEKRSAAEATAALVTTITADQAATVDAKTCFEGSGHADPTSVTVVVNKRHCMQPLNYEPAALATVYGATLSKQAASSFEQMYQAAAAAGQGFSVTSSYRSFSDQVTTYQYWVATSGVSGADTYSARPGYSEHQTGLVIDIAAGGCVLDCFGTTSQYQWMQAHAAEYGFIQRYYAESEPITGYKAEEWHYRYVGKDVALEMKQKNIKTLEELWNVSGGSY